ncbi:sulfurtransferase TusA family protein [Angustibacter aerolatus]
MTAAGPAEPVEVDARGLRCPLPVIRLAAAARDLPAGTELVVLATDPAAAVDVPAWCRMRGHVFLGADGERLAVRLGAPTP